MTNDYDLKIDNLSAEIKTAYLNPVDHNEYSKLNSALKADGRVERFYFEIVKTDWIRN